jgi:hypothetical protein
VKRKVYSRKEGERKIEGRVKKARQINLDVTVFVYFCCSLTFMAYPVKERM